MMQVMMHVSRVLVTGLLGIWAVEVITSVAVFHRGAAEINVRP
jgi:hypothetical protein